MKKPERRPRRVSPEHNNSTGIENSRERESGALPSLIEIKELIELVSNKQFNEFELQRGDFYLRVQMGHSRIATELSLPGTPASNALPEAYVPAVPQAVVAPAAVQDDEKLHIITSPIVGTFYRSPDPTSDPFTKIGDQVTSGQTLCIIEAMKLMNEIPSDTNGKVARIYVENGQPVEYGQRLFGLIV
ncbi:MAG: acetyl-CoA carboxylase biotin carboxyl carrier protein [Blastocatellia bacterium]|nr:acetyl-CoA carboxylase biotin carboxyl carrier protein [Blastocatellia bacterium]